MKFFLNNEKLSITISLFSFCCCKTKIYDCAINQARNIYPKKRNELSTQF